MVCTRTHPRYTDISGGREHDVFRSGINTTLYEMELWRAAFGDLPKLVKEGPPSSSLEGEMGSEEMWAQATVSRYGTASSASRLRTARVSII